MDVEDISAVVAVWGEQVQDLGARDFINYVQVFENRGAMMGCSNPHPHCQIWATEHIPNEPAKELASQQDYHAQHGENLLAAYLRDELDAGERLVCMNDHWVALVPFWAIWPFETMLIPRRAVTSLAHLHNEEQAALADILKRLTTRYDNLFTTSFPYSMGWHQELTDGREHPGCVLHAHFYPPLLRSATIRKFMVGFEMLAEPQRDITPEQAAERLRQQSEKHYREQ
jgi:UDPglucose--hexose-1-phosphate uridylyltransferase